MIGCFHKIFLVKQIESFFVWTKCRRLTICFFAFHFRERWSDSRERNRDRHRDRYRDSDRDSYRDSDRDSYRDSDRDHYRDTDRDRGAPRHYSEDFHHSHHQQQQQQSGQQKPQTLPQFNPSYSHPDFWLQAAQQVSHLTQPKVPLNVTKSLLPSA